jgi:hypothetical protein
MDTGDAPVRLPAPASAAVKAARLHSHIAIDIILKQEVDLSAENHRVAFAYDHERIDGV